MPIEDVGFLRANSVKQTYSFMIDSKDRDRASHPTPSNYTISFEQPFNAVVGLEVLEASIPRTMFNIDTYNNTLTFAIFSTNVPSTFQTIQLDAADHSVQSLIAALNASLNMHVDGDTTKPIASITVSTQSNPPELTSTLVFSCPYAFAFNMNPSTSTLAETLGFDLLASPTQPDRYTCTPNSPNLFMSVNLPLPHVGEQRLVLEGPRGVIRKLSLSTAKIAQRFTAPTSGYLTNVFAALTTADGVVPADVAVWTLCRSRPDDGLPDLTTAGAVALTNASGNPLSMGSIPTSYVDGGLSDTTNSVCTWLEAGDYWVLLHSGSSNLYMLYNDVVESALGNATTTFGSVVDNTFTSLDTDLVKYQASIRVEMSDAYHRLTAPGLYNLTGHRYVVMRCPEIEEHSYRSLAASKYHFGIAKFSMGSIGYSDQSTPFTKLPTREFHPIAKLSKMTLRFETPDGKPYDFKGVNHTVTFGLLYLEPIREEKTDFKSVLNPNYNADFINYMYFQQDQESDSEDGQDFSRDDPETAYAIAQLRNTPDLSYTSALDELAKGIGQ